MYVLYFRKLAHKGTQNEQSLLDDSLTHLTIHATKYSLSHSTFQAVHQELTKMWIR